MTARPAGGAGGPEGGAGGPEGGAVGPEGGAVRFGFLGAGWIAHQAMAPAVHAADGAVLQAVASRDDARARELEPTGRIYPDYAALLADPDVDAVYISLTNEAHLPWTLAALEAGKHVLCEKPLGLDVGQVAAMHEAAAVADRVLLEGYFYRWHPRMRRIEELAHGGALGAVLALSSEFSFDGWAEPAMAANYRLDPARGGGALYDVGVYPVSAAHALLGADLVVRAARQEIGPTGVDLDTQADLSPAALSPAVGGLPPVTAHVRAAIKGRAGQHLIVDAEAGRLSTAAGEAFTTWHAPSSLTIATPDGAVREEHFAPVDPYRLMVEAFARRVRGEDVWLVGADHSLCVCATLERIRSTAGSPVL